MLKALLILAGLCWLDIGTGILKAIYKDGKNSFSSKKLVSGLLGKCAYISILSVAGYYAYTAHDISIIKAFITYFSACESISIIDNAIAVRPDLSKIKGVFKK